MHILLEDIFYHIYPIYAFDLMFLLEFINGPAKHPRFSRIQTHISLSKRKRDEIRNDNEHSR
jgi:hypothetical protein